MKKRLLAEPDNTNDRDAFFDELDSTLERRLRDELDEFLASADDSAFMWSQESAPKTNAVTRICASTFIKAICAVSLLVIACLAAWNMRPESLRTFQGNSDLARQPVARPVASPAAHDPDATRRAPSVIADILTVVDYETPHETSNGERRWESLRRLYDRGVGAIKERPCDYAFTSPTQRLDETVRRLTASNSYASLDNGLDKRAFDNALMACVDPSSEVGAVMRYDPFFWMIGQALAVQ